MSHISGLSQDEEQEEEDETVLGIERQYVIYEGKPKGELKVPASKKAKA